MLRKDIPIDIGINLEFEYKGKHLEFQMVPVIGVKYTYPYEEISWGDIFDFNLDMTAQDVQNLVVESFEDKDIPIPYWAYSDAPVILVVMYNLVEKILYRG